MEYDCRALEIVYADLLQLSQYSTFALITEFQQVASAIVFNTPRPPRVVWSPDRKKFSVDGEVVIMDQQRTGLRQLYNDTKTLISDLCGDCLGMINMPEDIVDRMSNTDRGYSWLEHGPYTTTPLPLFVRLLEHPEWKIATTYDDTEIAWNIPAVNRFFQKTTQINQNMSVLNHVVPAPPSRATEFVNMRYRNSDRLRNLYNIMQQMYWFTIYSKTSNLTDHDLCIPALVPKELADIISQFLILIRPVEEILSHLTFEESSPSSYAEYMYVWNGKRATVDDFSRTLGNTLKRYTGSYLTVNPFRHSAVAISREFIPRSMSEHGARYADLCMGHGTIQARHTYAIDEDLRYITADAMWEFESVDRIWHDIFGFGENEPPPPCREMRALYAGKCKCAENQDRIVEAIQASMDSMRRRIIEDVTALINRPTAIASVLDVQQDTRYVCQSPLWKAKGMTKSKVSLHRKYQVKRPIWNARRRMGAYLFRA